MVVHMECFLELYLARDYIPLENMLLRRGHIAVVVIVVVTIAMVTGGSMAVSVVFEGERRHTGVRGDVR